jgi:hypothetical protein
MIQTKYPVQSDQVEPAMMHVVGRLYMQVEEAKEYVSLTSSKKELVESACGTLWYAVKAIQSLATACSTKQGAVHFSISSSNLTRQMADYIQDECGINPLTDTENPIVKSWSV